MVVLVCVGDEYVQYELREGPPRLEVSPLRVVADAQSAQESGRTGARGSSHETGGKLYSLNTYYYRLLSIAYAFSNRFSRVKVVFA